MAILGSVNVEQPSNVVRPNRPFSGYATERPRAKVWGNFGYMQGGEFISLPLGCPIDTMEPASESGQNVEVITRNKRKNKALAAFQAIGAKMAPGETKFIEVVFQLRRVNEDVEIAPTEDDLEIDAIMDLLAPSGNKKAVEKSLTEDAGDPGMSKADIAAQIKALQAALKAVK